jgi:ABC-type phosphate transport system substrate-binding protein
MNTTIGKLLLAAGVWLAAAPVMAAEIVVIVNPKNPATRMFSEQAGQFFLGKSTLFTPDRTHRRTVAQRVL